MMGDLLDHLAEHFLFLSTATSYWYSLNSSYDHEFHLSRRLGLSPKDYEQILVAANLAHYHPTWGFTILVDRLKMFLDGHRCCESADGTVVSFEVATKKIDLNAFILGSAPKHRVTVHVIRIGRMTDRSPQKIEWQKHGDGRMNTTPPRLIGLRLQQQSFRKVIDPFSWKYFIDNRLDTEEGDSDDDSSSIEKDEMSIEADDDNDENGTSSPNKSKSKKPNNNVLGDNDDSLDNLDMAKSYPHLARALGGEDGFDPTNPSVLKSMRCLLTELNDLLSTTYELNIRDMTYKKISYVRVPRTSSDRSFQNSKEWVDTAIQIAGSKHSGTFEAAYRIANHLLRFYRDLVLAACENQKVPICKEMSATQFQAMMCAAKVTGTGEKEIKKHLSAHLGFFVDFCHLGMRRSGRASAG